jgi:hypothetical protein
LGPGDGDPPALEVFEALGIVDRFMDAGAPQRAARLYSAALVTGR